MMFKEYISVTAEFLIIRQVSIAKKAAQGERASHLQLSAASVQHWPFLLHDDINEIYRTLRAILKVSLSLHLCKARLPAWLPVSAGAQRQQGEAPRPGDAAHAPARCPAWYWNSKPRANAEPGLSKHAHWQLLYYEHRKGTSWITERICWYHRGRFICPVINLSSFSLKPVSILIPCFYTSSLILFQIPKFPASAGLQTAPLHLPVKQPSASFWPPKSLYPILCYYLRAVLIPS